MVEPYQQSKVFYIHYSDLDLDRLKLSKMNKAPDFLDSLTTNH